MKVRIFRDTVDKQAAEMDLQIFLQNIPQEEIYQIDTFYSKGAGTLVFIYYKQ
jgi:hypothetical protein